jgi:hypothetical protein
MANNVKNATNFPKSNERRGLYRVWVALHDDGKAPLISIWIDPDLRAFEFCTEEENPAGARTQVSCLSRAQNLQPLRIRNMGIPFLSRHVRH